MAKLESVTVAIKTRYVFVVIPFATYKRVGEIGILTVFGIPVYKHVGDVRSLLGVTYRAS